MRPKKKSPDRRGVLLKEQPFTFRQRENGTVAIFWKRQRVAVLAGKLAENFLAAAPESSGEELQLLMARAAGNFKRPEGRRRS